MLALSSLCSLGWPETLLFLKLSYKITGVAGIFHVDVCSGSHTILLIVLSRSAKVLGVTGGAL